jgi:hypothetical protein
VLYQLSYVRENHDSSRVVARRPAGYKARVHTHRYLAAVLSAAAVGSVVTVERAAPASASHSFPSFFTPGKLALCKLQVGFEAPKDFVPDLNCWRPRDGFTVTLGSTGRPLSGPLKANKRLESFTLRRWLLPFGESWWGTRAGDEGRGRGPSRVLYRCTSRSNGLTCRSVVSARGFWLGRFRGHRIF